MTSVDNVNLDIRSCEGVAREVWVTPAIESFEPVSVATESITSTNPGDIINSNS